MLDSVDKETTKDFTGTPFAGLNRKLSERHYSLVVVMAGTNDLGHGRDARVSYG